MAYQALYRKFRPKNFNEVYGQDHIVKTLKNQLAAERIGHAYVFSGTRGTGKTSIAKIFAKALNCENPIEGNPCGECASCRAISEGSSLNVHEVDGASNNGVDNIRQIIEDVSYPPVSGKYKVYIIDEAHMVTSQAFNALLKTIEEPPGYALFILATTEVIKIPATILSRCQRYDFHRITVDMIARRMEELRNLENISIEDRAIRYIARLADGSLRDALSIFDQCISYYFGQDISYDMTLEMLGTADSKMFSNLFRAVNDHDAKTAIDIAGEAIIRGMEPESFVSDFVWYLRNLLLVKNGEKIEDVADISTEDANAFMEEVDIATEPFIMRAITVMSELINQIRFSTVKRICLETGLIRLCTPKMDTDNGALLDRIRQLENRISSNIPSGKAPRITDDTHQSPKVPMSDEDFYADQMSAYDEDFENAVGVPSMATIANPVINSEGSKHASNTPKAMQEMPERKEVVEKKEQTPARGGDFADMWNEYIAFLQEPDKSFTCNGVVDQISETRADIYFVKKSRGAGWYGKPERAKALEASIEKFMGRHIDVSVKIVEESEIPTIEESRGNNPSEESVDMFSNLNLSGLTVEIEE